MDIDSATLAANVLILVVVELGVNERELQCTLAFNYWATLVRADICKRHVFCVKLAPYLHING